MINIAICDDEISMLNVLKEQLHNFFYKENIAANIELFSNGNSLLQYDRQLDIIFLDIQMHGRNGIETARLLRKQNYKGFLIFVTVMEEYVFDSFEVQAFDYLLKPIERQRFIKVMNRLMSAIRSYSDNSLLIQRGSECRIIPYDDIMYCEIINRKVFLHLIHNITVDYYGKIHTLEQKLDKRFFKCHRSYLINLKYLKRYEKGLAYLNSGETIPVSRLRSEEFKEIILQYIKERGC